MSGGSILIVLTGVVLLVAAIYKSGSSDSGWTLFKGRLTRLLLVVAGILLIILAFGHPGQK